MPFLLDAKTPQSLPGSQEAAVSAAGADSASHRSRAARPSPLLPLRAASHRLRRLALRISVVAKYLNSKDSASSRRPSYPASPSSRAHPFGPSRPRPWRESVPRASCRSLPAAGSLRSPVRCPVKARQADPSRHPPGPTLHCVPRHWWLGDSVPHRPTTPETPNHQRLLS